MSEPALTPAAPAAPAAPAPAAPVASAPAAVWHEGKIDPTVVGFWQNKGIDPADPVAVASKLTEFYRNSEKLMGAPPEEIIRIPKANAAETDIKAYWGRIGVPAEAKDYNLSAVKMNGKDLDQGFADSIREALLDGRVPKDRAANIAQRMVKRQEDMESAAMADRTAIINEQKTLLEKNWGTNKAYNELIAKRTLEEVGKAAGLTPEQTKQGWDAISAGNVIGGSYAMEMLRTIGAKMGESTFISSDPNNGNNNQVMSKAQAVAEIESLKKDKGFYQRYVVNNEVAAKRQWDDLHKIAYA